jgi:general nucleoside transport system permease protein
MSLETVLRSIFSAFFLASVIRISTPIIFPAMGGLLAITSGASNIALEGIMLWGAFTGVMVSAYTGNVWFAVLCGVIVGVLVAELLAVFHIKYGADLFLAGLAINLFSSGGTVFLLYTFTGQKGNTSILPSLSVPNVAIPIIKDIPILGQILSGHPVFTYLAFFLVFVIFILLYRTKFGAHLRAVGENPEAAKTLGISVAKVRYIALGLSGALAALGGMSLSMAYLQMFQRDMSAGRGWIGIAAVWLGAKHPVGTLIAAMIFGFADAVANQLGSLKIPSQLVQIIPYATTIIALVVYSIQQRQAAINRMKKYQEAHFAEEKALKEKAK